MTGQRRYRDRLFQYPSKNPFRFDERVAEVFEEMVERSIPGYRDLLKGIAVLSRRHLVPKSFAYDLGCSLGAAAFVMAQEAPQDITILAVDNAWPMISRLKERLAATPFQESILPVCADIRDLRIKNASQVVLNFTLQFIAPEERLELLCKIHEGLLPGGALILSEKIEPKQPEERLWLTFLHHRFKEAQGYRRLEIHHKREALERVLLPDSVEAHEERFCQAGFGRVMLWFQKLNFVSFLAQKCTSH